VGVVVEAESVVVVAVVPLEVLVETDLVELHPPKMKAMLMKRRPSAIIMALFSFMTPPPELLAL
jgi:hypothetical protein